MAAAVQVGAEVRPILVDAHGLDRVPFGRGEPPAALHLVGHLSMAKAEDLEAAGVRGEYPRPAHEAVQAARGLDQVRAGLDRQVVGVAYQ